MTSSSLFAFILAFLIAVIFQTAAARQPHPKPDNLQPHSDKLQFDQDKLQLQPDNLKLGPDNLKVQRADLARRTGAIDDDDKHRELLLAKRKLFDSLEMQSMSVQPKKLKANSPASREFEQRSGKEDSLVQAQAQRQMLNDRGHPFTSATQRHGPNEDKQRQPERVEILRRRLLVSDSDNQQRDGVDNQMSAAAGYRRALLTNLLRQQGGNAATTATVGLRSSTGAQQTAPSDANETPAVTTNSGVDANSTANTVRPNNGTQTNTTAPMATTRNTSADIITGKTTKKGDTNVPLTTTAEGDSTPDPDDPPTTPAPAKVSRLLLAVCVGVPCAVGLLLFAVVVICVCLKGRKKKTKEAAASQLAERAD